MTWLELADWARAAGLSDPEVRVVLEEASGSRYAQLLPALRDEADSGKAAHLEQLVADRCAGVPLQHLVGHWSFRRLELVVDRRALIPRPETEIVVEVVLAELARIRAGRLADAPLRLADLGTGSGAIACALVDEDPDVEVVAVDCSREALALAAENRERLSPETRRRLVLGESDWFTALAALGFGMLDCVVSNPPYVAVHEWDELAEEVRAFDPRGALVAGETGLECAAAIIARAPVYLREDGALVLEIAPHQASAIAELAEADGATAVIHRDLVGRERVAVLRW